MSLENRRRLISIAGESISTARSLASMLAHRLRIRTAEAAALDAATGDLVVASSTTQPLPRGDGRRMEFVLRNASAPASAATRVDHEPVAIDAAASPIEIVEHMAMHLARSGYVGEGTIHFAEGGRTSAIDRPHAADLIDRLLAALGPLERVLLIPPDFTRYHSGAGELTCLLHERLRGRSQVRILPALGTHVPMSAGELQTMYPGIPAEVFRVHDWRSGLRVLGEVPGSFVRAASGGRLAYPIPCEVDGLLTGERWDRIISIGQLVPHEVIGIAGHDKNLFIGTGGKGVIDRTHFLGAVCGMEQAMGRAHSPVRDVIRYMAGAFGHGLPITHVLTVRERDARGLMVTRGLIAGDHDAPFALGARLVKQCNLQRLLAPCRKVVVYLDPAEYKSTWLGNKAVYRTRMAIADGGELLIVGPGVARFGEDRGIDRLIRRHGYRGTPHTLAAVESDPELAGSLSAAAHLIHGSSEDRFRIIYAAGGLTRDEVAGVGYDVMALDEALGRYDPQHLVPGLNRLPDGEEIFFVSNPALGLWGLERQFADGAEGGAFDQDLPVAAT